MERQTLSEGDLIRMAQDGNPEAFGDLYLRHIDSVYRYVYSRVGETGEAENLAQSIFLKAWRALGSYRQKQTPFLGWLYRIAHNTVIDYYRACREPACCLEGIELADTNHVPEEGFISQERQELLRKALTRIKPVYQQVIALRFLNGMDYAEAAQVLGRNVNAVRVLQFRALQALRAALAEEGAGQ